MDSLPRFKVLGTERQDTLNRHTQLAHRFCFYVVLYSRSFMSGGHSMGDYYTLIARAVLALSDNTADARQNLYERARVALTSSLIRHHPPMSEADFERERSALEAAMTRVEHEQTTIGQTQTADATKTEPGSTAPANILPAPSVSTLEVGIKRFEQEPPIDQTQAADAAKAEPIESPPVEETTGSTGPANILPATLRSIRDPTLPRIMPIRKTFVYVDRVLRGVTCVISIAFAFAIFLRPSWVTRIFDYLFVAACSAIILCTLGVLPIAQARVSKVGLSCAFLASSYLLGMTTWLLGVLLTLHYWGMMGLVIGLCLGIVGVVPLGIVAATMNADWSMVAMMIVGALATYGARKVASSAIEDSARSIHSLRAGQ